MSEVKLHVDTLDRFIGDTMAMAERLDRGERERQTAHIAFESMEMFLKVLTPNRWALLRALRSRGPSSAMALARGPIVHAGDWQCHRRVATVRACPAGDLPGALRSQDPPEVNFASPPTLPAALTPRRDRLVERLRAVEADVPDTLAATVFDVCLASDYVLGVLERQTAALLARTAAEAPADGGALAEALAEAASEEAALRALRNHRHVEMARIAWRDIAGFADLDTTLAELSDLADSLITAAHDYAVRQLEARHGRARKPDGQPAPLLVLGMGKLGGRELNFSSDVDLVFLFPDDAGIDGGEPEDVEPYFNRLARTLIRLLDATTQEGFAFRVDARLRPFGKSGPLAISVAALESYLVRHGRDWERYAYIKARLITGREYADEVFGQILEPFVYRRYLDFGVFDALRQMARLIGREVERKEMAANIKRGPGGIREIEFIVQAFQLVRGGPEPRLRRRNLQQALAELERQGQIDAESGAVLREAYRFLRRLENRLQQYDDRQTHDLPDETVARARLARSMGSGDWAALAGDIEAHRAAVERQFAQVTWEAPAARDDGDERESRRAAWDRERLDDMLTGTALEGDAEALQLLEDLRGGGLYRRMDEVARQRLADVMIGVMPLLDRCGEPGRALRRFVTILRAICRRSAYIALLNENPATLQRLLDLADQSALIASQIADHPVLLDELLDPRILDEPLTRDALEQMYKDQLAGVDGHDTEAALEAVRQFQRAALLRIAIADRVGSLELMQVSDRLTETAELVLKFAFDAAWREFVEHYGVPRYRADGPAREAGFAIVGYGKLGGLELGYGSDLDLVFLHDSSGDHQETAGPNAIDNSRFFSRLVQRLMHFLTIQTTTGRLYEIDTRLRPSGSSGLLVASLETFRRYEQHEAWTWEHQALLRSRAVAGSAAVCDAFEEIRHDVLVNHVDRGMLKEQVIKMRERMRRELSQSAADSFDLKQDSGGMADIEFLVDYWVLDNAARHPELIRFPDNIRQLERLEAAGLIAAERAAGLREAYIALRRRTHELALNEAPRVVGRDEFVDTREFVAAIWTEVFG